MVSSPSTRGLCANTGPRRQWERNNEGRRGHSRFQGGWGFFASEGVQPATLLAATESCYTCHAAHGAVDTTFTQFYPTAKEIAVAKHSLREEDPL